MKYKKTTGRKMSFGIFISYDEVLIMYDVREQDFIQLVENDTKLNQKEYKYLSRKTFFSGNFYSKEEKKEYIKHKMLSFPNKQHFYLSLANIERSSMILNGKTVTVLLKKEEQESFYYYNTTIEKEKLFECFLFLLSSGERMLALNDKQAKKKHCENMKMVKNELECKPKLGVRFLKAQEEFNSTINKFS